MTPIRSLPNQIQHLVAELPVQLEEVPRAVERLGVQEVASIRVDGLLELLEGRDPWRGALEHGQLLHLVGDGRHDLHRAGSAADDRYPPAADIETRRPVAGVERRGGKDV